MVPNPFTPFTLHPQESLGVLDGEANPGVCQQVHQLLLTVPGADGGIEVVEGSPIGSRFLKIVSQLGVGTNMVKAAGRILPVGVVGIGDGNPAVWPSGAAAGSDLFNVGEWAFVLGGDGGHGGEV